MRFFGVQPPAASADASIPMNFDAPEARAGCMSAAAPAGEAPVQAASFAARPVEKHSSADGGAARRLVRIAFTADEELHTMVLRSQQLMRHKYPDGRLEGIFRDALKLLIEEKDLGLKAAKAAERKARRAAGRSLH